MQAHRINDSTWSITIITRSSVLCEYPFNATRACGCAVYVSSHHIAVTVMSLLSINDDVLYIIVSHLKSKDALRFSETTKKLHLLGTQQALSSVTLYYPCQLISLHKYLLSPSAGDRMSFLHELKTTWHVWGLNTANPDFSPLPLFADILENAHHLKSISFHMTEQLINASPRILPALVALNLESIKIRTARITTLDALRAFRRGPKVLHLRLADEHYYNQPRLCKAVSYLSQLPVLESLQVLDLQDLNITYGLPPGKLCAGPRWPELRRLSMWLTSIPAPLLARAFPNLKHIELDDVEVTDVAALPWVAPDVAILAHGEMRYPIHSVDLEHFKGYSLYGLMERHVAVLRCMSPVVLAVSSAQLVPLWKELLELAPRLRYLDVRLLSGQMVNMRAGSELIQEWLDTVPSLLVASRVICARIYVQNPSKYWHEDIRDTLFECIPSLRYIAAESVHYQEDKPDNLYTWWRVDGTGKERRLAEISREAGERVHAFLHSDEFEKQARDGDPDAPFPVFG